MCPTFWHFITSSDHLYNKDLYKHYHFRGRINAVQ